MQPALDKACLGRRAAQRILQPCQWTYQAEKGLGGNVQDGGKMREPEPSISHKAQPHPAACPNQRETADDKQYEQKMNDKYDIGHLLNTFAKLPIQKQQYNKRILLGYFWIFVSVGIVIALICRIPSVSGSSSALIPE